jgi:hypothetical protein
MEIIKKAGLVAFAVGTAGVAFVQMLYKGLDPVFLASQPAWLPWYPLWAYIGNVAVIFACGVILYKKNHRQAAIWLASGLLVLFAASHIPYQAMHYPTHPGMWTNALKSSALAGGALIVAGMQPTTSNPALKSLKIGGILFAITMVVFGWDHFIYTDFVATLVPNWIAGHVFCTYFAGIALMASGTAIMLNIKAQLAATLLGIMLFIWLAILHIPRAVADPYGLNGNECRSVFEALAFSGIAFILASINKSKKGENFVEPAAQTPATKRHQQTAY